jgi:hypothetical protein
MQTPPHLTKERQRVTIPTSARPRGLADLAVTADHAQAPGGGRTSNLFDDKIISRASGPAVKHVNTGLTKLLGVPPRWLGTVKDDGYQLPPRLRPRREPFAQPELANGFIRPGIPSGVQQIEAVHQNWHVASIL